MMTYTPMEENTWTLPHPSVHYASDHIFSHEHGLLCADDDIHPSVQYHINKPLINPHGAVGFHVGFSGAGGIGVDGDRSMERRRTMQFENPSASVRDELTRRIHGLTR